jgi:hypothetical protein
VLGRHEAAGDGTGNRSRANGQVRAPTAKLKRIPAERWHLHDGARTEYGDAIAVANALGDAGADAVEQKRATTTSTH